MSGLWEISEFEKISFANKATELGIKLYDYNLQYIGNLEVTPE